MVKNPEWDIRSVKLDFLKELSPGIYILGFRREFDFIAGQVIGIAVENQGPRRLYSICSGEKEKQVKILYNEVEEGYLTPRLSRLRAGDSIWITPPRGEFICSEKEAVWIAAGTGIAPFYAMLKSGRANGKILLHGERKLQNFYFSEEFMSGLGDNYIRCCSGEKGEGFYQGRVTAWLEDNELPSRNLKYYLCGSAEMVVDTRDILIEKGIAFDQIVSEIYF